MYVYLFNVDFLDYFNCPYYTVHGFLFFSCWMHTQMEVEGKKTTVILMTKAKERSKKQHTEWVNQNVIK